MTQEISTATNAKGHVIKAFGNLVHVRFEGNIRQGEVGSIELGDLHLSAEVIEIKGDEAKMQVFEDTRGIKLGTSVHFSDRLLEAELGPGLLTSIFDGLQNPLEDVAEISGLFLTRGVSVAALDRVKKWEFIPTAKVGDLVRRGDAIGFVMEGSFHHQIMVPFSMQGKYKVKSIIGEGSYTIEHEMAKIEDAAGKEYSITMMQKWPVKMALREGKQVEPETMMSCGLRILDTQLPILKGGTFCTPGPFGAGKTVLQHHLARFSDVDIVIMAACGERAGEVVDILREFPHLIDERTGLPLSSRTVIIANTSSMPVAARESSVYLGVTIAEYYRQMGLEVLLLADSTSRWAQAMREMSGRLEEIPGEEAFPAYLSSRIASFYERAGVVQLKEEKKGSLTIGGAVSPAGGNFEEPVTQATLAVVGAFLGLSRERSDARRYPAIDPLISWTKYLDKVGKELSIKEENWAEKVRKCLFLLRQGYEIGRRMEVVGIEGTAIEDMILYLKAELYDNCYLQQNAFDKEDAFTSFDRQLELFKLMQIMIDSRLSFDSHDDARAFFLSLQNDIKNMNYTSFHSDHYQSLMTRAHDQLKQLTRVG